MHRRSPDAPKDGSRERGGIEIGVDECTWMLIENVTRGKIDRVEILLVSNEKSVMNGTISIHTLILVEMDVF